MSIRAAIAVIGSRRREGTATAGDTGALAAECLYWPTGLTPDEFTGTIARLLWPVCESDPTGSLAEATPGVETA